VLIDKGADRPQERVFCWYSHKLIVFGKLYVFAQSTAPIEKRRLPVLRPPGKRLTTQLTVQSGWLRISNKCKACNRRSSR
jgi:hypothetical protein